ncbi:MAG TPA: type II toxin-antitoxin system ParD family antitoxin [Caulobacteraceae bacterium]|jgi:antitoxin ParD1/3/4
MSKIEKLSIALTPELAEAVREAVQKGEYASTSEVIREALREWGRKRDERAASIAHYRKLWDEGVASGIAEERMSAAEFKKRARARTGKGRAA